MRCAGVALFALVTALGCGQACGPGGSAARANVVLVTIDTLRADHLGCYGDTSARTPHLDRLAAAGTRFDRCWAQTDTTVPSHLSILSSLPLAEHGVLHNGDTPRRPIEVLPRLFTAAGYRAAAFVSAWHLGPKGPLGSLLGDFDPHRGPGRVPNRAAETNAQVFDWLDHGCHEPFFLWVHYFDPHMPYEPPPPFDAYYTGDPRDGGHDGMAGVRLRWLLHDLRGLRRTLAPRAADVRALKHAHGLGSRGVRRLILHPEEIATRVAAPARASVRHQVRDLGGFLHAHLPLRPHLADWLTGVRDLRYPLARYAGEVSYVDAEIGRLHEALVARGLAERTIVLVTADHGEALGEHGIYFTHFGLHEPVLRVPLIVWAPGRVPAGVRGDPVQGLDVAPTLLALAGLPVPGAMQGRDLFGDPRTDVPVVSEAQSRQQVMLFDGRWKLIRTLRDFHLVDAFERPAGARELYDLSVDPDEREDVAARRPEVAQALGARLDTWLAAHGSPTDGAAPTPAVLERLRALGYVE